MVKLSAAVITFNEEKNIVSLLNNLYPIFDEIVIVDGISLDKTIRLVEEYKSTIDTTGKIRLYLFSQAAVRYSGNWKQSSQRNLALERVSGDWVFCIDADERLDSDARVRLEDATNGLGFAWALPTYHYWDTEDQVRVDDWWYPNYHYRFWKNRMGIKYSSHSRHCFPVIKGKPDVRTIKEANKQIPFLNEVPIHHYHHCPIKQKPGGGYRSNFKDVKTLEELNAGLQIEKVSPRKKGPMEV